MKDRSLHGKLMFMSFALLGVAVIVGIVGFVGVSFVAKAYQRIPQENMPNVVSVNQMMLEVRRTRIGTVNLFSKGLTPALREKSYRDIAAAIKDFKAVQSDYLSVPFTSAVEKLRYDDFDKASIAFFKLVDQLVDLDRAGTLTARECGEILGEIVKNVGRVTVMAGDISTASAEQATGVGEITKAMNQLDQVTQQNAATSEESASAAEELSAQAESLTALVGELVAVVTGGQTLGVPAAVAASTAKASKVLPIKRKVKSTARAIQASSQPLKKVAGDGMAPSFDDNRFEDI